MNNLYCARVERRDFGDLLSHSTVQRMALKRVSDYSSLRAPDGNALLAVWSKDPIEVFQLPNLLVCREGTEGDWTAWITTFASKLRPFSALTRLLSDVQVSMVLQEGREPSLGQLLWPVAGLVLGELLLAFRLPNNALEAVSASACESTLSFAIFRAAAMHKNFSQWPKLIDDWNTARQLTRQTTRGIESRLVARVCAIILDGGGFHFGEGYLVGDDIRVARACRELIDMPHRTPMSFAMIPEFSAAEVTMNESRELRVVATDRFIRVALSMPPHLSELTSLVLGWLVSRITPGTLHHLSLLEPVLQRYPTSVLWYGFCAGLGGGEVDRQAGDTRHLLDFPGSARRVVRELLRDEPNLGTPSYDISLLELVTLSRASDNPLEGIVTTTQGTAVVELFPFVSTTINALPKVSNEPPRSSQREQKILATMGTQIERLRETLMELVRTRDEGVAEQSSLFPQRRKKK